MWKKITAIIIAVALIAGLAVYLVIDSKSYVAKVADERIKTFEYEFFLNLKKTQIEREYELSDKTEEEKTSFWQSNSIDGDNAEEYLKKAALDMAKEYKVQILKAEEYGISIDKDDIAAIDAEFDYYTQNEESKQIFKSYVEEDLGISLPQFREIKTGLRLIDKFAAQYIKDNRNAVSVSEEESKAYYEENKLYIDQVTARHILIKTVNDNFEELSEDLIKAAKDKADQLLARVNNGEDMAKLVTEFTEDTASIEGGGLYTFDYSQQYMEEFKDWAFNADVNDTGIVKTFYGYHVMRLENRTGYDDRKDFVASQAKMYKLSEYYEEQLDTWKKDSQYNLIINEKVFK